MTNNSMIAQHTPDWYERRHELREGMVFRCDVGIVKLDGRVPGDGTKWYVANWCLNTWVFDNRTIEPGDLEGEPIADDRAAITKAAGTTP